MKRGREMNCTHVDRKEMDCGGMQHRAHWRKVVLLLGIWLWLPVAEAEVTAVGPGGFVSEHRLSLPTAPGVAYRALTEEIAAWWDANHSYSGEAANFSLDARAGGCFCERLADGGSVEHMRVVFAQPGVLLRMQGGLGPLQGMGVTGSMEFRFSDDGEGGAWLDYRYSVAGFVPGGLESISGPVDQVQLGQLERLADYLAGRSL